MQTHKLIFYNYLTDLYFKKQLNRKFLGIDLEEEFLQLSRERKLEIENPNVQKQFCKKMGGFLNNQQLLKILLEE